MNDLSAQIRALGHEFHETIGKAQAALEDLRADLATRDDRIVLLEARVRALERRQ